jgi:hypothetical protein
MSKANQHEGNFAWHFIEPIDCEKITISTSMLQELGVNIACEGFLFTYVHTVIKLFTLHVRMDEPKVT